VGANILHVMKRLGHRDIRTTLNTYAHVFPSDEAELAGMFAADLEPDNVAAIKGGANAIKNGGATARSATAGS